MRPGAISMPRGARISRPQRDGTPATRGVSSSSSSSSSFIDNWESCDIHTTITGISVTHPTRTIIYRDTSKHKYFTY